MAKGKIIRALMGMKHSPAGKSYLAYKSLKKEKKTGTEDVYFKGNKRKTTEQRLKDAGLSESDLRSLRGKG